MSEQADNLFGVGRPSELSHFHGPGGQVVTLRRHELVETVVRSLLREAEHGRITIPATTFLCAARDVLRRQEWILATEQHDYHDIVFRLVDSAP